MKKTGLKNGLSLVELLVAISIIAIVSGLSISVFANFSRLSLVEGTAEAVVSQLRTAQKQTIESLGGNQFGVHITSTSSTIFVGSQYQSGDASNTVFAFSSGAIASSTLSDYVFQKLSGTTTSGTIDIYASSNQSFARTISIEETGTVSVK